MDMDRIACYRAISTRDARFDGRLFVGVKTTGIYCRPICPARTPNFANVSFYPSAAAAQQAGFRPCLRCRPETSPDLAFWRGTTNTVSRALALIEAGGLDEADVEGLANRLGVGARQLRRLFRQHVGASPVAVAQTRRVLLAKQLIHETSLPMAEVAMASGFNSIRRFNETFLQLFGRSPATLRRIRDKTRREAGALSVRLAYRPPYDWDAMRVVSRGARHSRCRSGLGQYLPAHDFDRRRSRRDQRITRPTGTGSTSRCDFRIWRRCHRSSRGCGGYSISPPIPI